MKLLEKIINWSAPLPPEPEEKHVMLDLETLGREPGCCILSIGAVRFDPYSDKTFGSFSRNIYLPSCYEAGLTSEPETLAWWNEQDRAAVESLAHEQIFIRQACFDFARWLEADDNTRIWCQGATFDAPILAAAFKAVGLDVPWKFWAVRDTRTVYDVCEFDPKTIERQGPLHVARADAEHQVRCVQAALNPPSLWDEIKNAFKNA